MKELLLSEQETVHCDICDLTTVAKRLVRELKGDEPIVSPAMLSDWIKLSKISPNHTDMKRVFEYHLGATVEGDILRALMTHLHKVYLRAKENLATANNLARMCNTTLFFTKDELEDLKNIPHSLGLDSCSTHVLLVLK